LAVPAAARVISRAAARFRGALRSDVCKEDRGLGANLTRRILTI